MSLWIAYDIMERKEEEKNEIQEEKEYDSSNNKSSAAHCRSSRVCTDQVQNLDDSTMYSWSLTFWCVAMSGSSPYLVYE